MKGVDCQTIKSTRTAAKNRASEGGFYTIVPLIAEGMGIADKPFFYLDEWDKGEWDEIAALSLEEYRNFIYVLAYADMVFTDGGLMDEYLVKARRLLADNGIDASQLEDRNSFFETVLNGTDIYKNVILYNAFRKNVPDAARLQASLLDIAEKVRRVFIRHIERNEWMSDAYKESFISKAKSTRIVFAAQEGLPTVFTGTPEFSESAAVGNLSHLRMYNDNIKVFLGGKDMKEYPLEHVLTYYLITEEASYSSKLEYIALGPMLVMPQHFGLNADEAFNYGMLAPAVAHELAHILAGAAPPSVDQPEYMRRAMLLISSYSQLPVMEQELPGLMVDGAKNWIENVADVCGLAVAYEAYLDYLKEQGFTDEELEQQERRFFEAAAGGLRSKYDAATAKYLVETDGHTMNEPRVNGMMQHIDRWYELFDVTPENKLYLKPEERTTMW